MLESLLHRRGTLQWLDTDAGVLLLLSVNLKPLWSGIEAPKDGRVIQATFRWNPDAPASDYDRACDVSGYAGLIPVGSGVGLVLGEDPLPTTWHPLPEGGILLVRLYTSETGNYPDTIPPLPTDLTWETVGDFSTDGSPLVLFDSTEPGDEPPNFPSVPVELAEGRYAVDSTTWKHPLMELRLVRLRPVGKGPSQRSQN